MSKSTQLPNFPLNPEVGTSVQTAFVKNIVVSPRRYETNSEFSITQGYRRQQCTSLMLSSIEVSSVTEQLSCA